MRVHDSNLNSVSIGTHSTGRSDSAQSGRSGASGSQGSAGQDRISLSDLGSLVRSASSETTDRSERVNQLASAYKSGNYRANAAGAAKGIVNEAYKGA